MVGLKIIIAMHSIFYLHNIGICYGQDSTLAPVTEAPVTEAPTTLAPVTEAPTTLAPVTEGPTTLAPNLDREFCTGCGLVHSSLGHYDPHGYIRIVGGAEVAKGSYPGVVAVIKVLPKKEFNRCGGTIIKPGWVLTSASCIINTIIKRIYVSVNDHDLGTTKEMKSKTHYVHKSIIHPRFQKDYTRDHDIALLQLKVPVDFKATGARPICLGTTDDETVGSKTTMLGWGQTIGGDDSSYSGVLIGAEASIYSSTECQEKYDDLPHQLHMHITNNTICTFTQGQDSCHGDGGGPVLKRLEDGRYVQIGVIGFGYGCGKFNVPGVHLRLSQYRHWINYVTYHDHC